MASNLSDASLKAPFLIPGGSPLARMSSFSTGSARDAEKRRVVAECYQPGVSVSVVARRHDRSRYGRRRFRRVSAYRMAAASGIFAETLGSCVRHLVTDHLKTGADRRWLISLFFSNHRTTINDRRKFRFLVRRWQKSNGFPAPDDDSPTVGSH